ncbi:MAG: nuclear transport factor 2 family protein [Caldimonas sp.]
MTALEWTPKLFASIDAKDTEGFLAFLSDDACFSFANLPPAVGRAAIREAVGGFFAGIASCRHEVSKVWSPDDSVICEGQVTYTRLDGSTLSVPFVNVFGMAGSLIRQYSIYVDAAALFPASIQTDAAPVGTVDCNGAAAQTE